MNEDEELTLFWKNKSKPELKEVDLKILETRYVKKKPKFLNNLLFHADNLDVLFHLTKNFKEKLDLIYIDPPFATGETFKHKIKISNGSWTIIDNFLEKEAYDDTWGRDLKIYLQMLYERMYLMRLLLSKKGSIFVHVDWRVSAYVRLMLDEIFGKNNFLNEIIWNYVTPGYPRDRFAKKHDTIFWYAKSAGNHIFNLDEVRTPYDEARKKKATVDEDGDLVYVHGPGFGVTKLHPKGRITDDVWKIALVNSMAKERTTYPTQKPQELLERIIKAATERGSLVADFFCGSGTTLIAAENLGRWWIGADNSFHAIHTTKKRLLEEPINFSFYSKSTPEMDKKDVSWEFDIQNEGKNLQITFKNYHNEKINEILKQKVVKFKSPSDLIDYWAIDFDYKDQFNLNWCSFKTRSDNSINITCSHDYKDTGQKILKIRFVDIFNNFFGDQFKINIVDKDF